METLKDKVERLRAVVQSWSPNEIQQSAQTLAQYNADVKALGEAIEELQNTYTHTPPNWEYDSSCE